jgi:hypothetical protein
MRGSLLVLGFVLGCSGTSSTPSVGTPITNPTAGDAGSADAGASLGTCGDDGKDLSGATWSLAKSKFAFGGTPTESSSQGQDHFTGPEGAGIAYAGGAMMIPNAGAPAGGRPDFSNDANIQTAHVRAYLQTFGIPDCQVSSVSQLGSGGGGGPVGGPTTTYAGHLTIALNRGIGGSMIADSHANAEMNDQDASSREDIWWPAIPASVVAQAKQMQTDFADPAKLAAFQAKLPDGDGALPGVIRIHHNYPDSKTFSAVVTWDVERNGSGISYDANGQMWFASF